MSSSPSERLYAGQVLAGYRLEKSAGRGGFGDVLQAIRLSDDTRVAIKVLRPKHHGDLRREQQLLREGRILQSLDHPRILRCLDVGRSGSWTFLVLPWLEGQPLSRVLGNGPLSRKIALDCAFQVLEALDYIHKKGVIHQDVKPDNILINKKAKCTLFDFGLAMTRKDALRERASGGVLRIVGSTSYRAPEQATPGATVGARADIYAFAVTLHRMISAELPTEGVLDPSLGDELIDILRPCLSATPSDRPSAQALRRQLHSL